jgi:hypothetical protein
MGIQKFTFSPSLTRGFARFGYEIYQGDPCWIPPFEDELIAQLSRFLLLSNPRQSLCAFSRNLRKENRRPDLRDG